MSGKIEILAPAGSESCVKAAVRCGADAVYLGTKDFNARKNADNFTFEQLGQIIGYCHARGVKVHVTFNTLVRDDELEKAMNLIKHICDLGADVLILQDLGLCALTKKTAPALERHASTQMSVQTCAGMKLLEKQGFSMAVLPRELTKTEIENIKRNTNIRLETFVHGALCMCISGQCYLSAMLGGRSGNRGLCAQPCRLAFSAGEPGRHDLSLKDLSLVKNVNELASLGVGSLKIEGRMKRPEYVAAAVTAVKNSIFQKEDEQITHALSAVFSRSGFTDGYYENNRGKDMFGIRTKQDVTAANNKLLSSLERLYDKETPRVKVSFILNVCKDEKVSLCASANGASCFVSENYIPEKALNKPCTKEALSQRLAKCGGTFFEADTIEINLDEGLIVPASVINSLRRKALEELERKLSCVKPKSFTPCDITVKPHQASGKAGFHVRITDISQLPENTDNVENL
ncbi:MAG: U32 family peptidase, partial [Acutalibacteraceae bacterium]